MRVHEEPQQVPYGLNKHVFFPNELVEITTPGLEGVTGRVVGVVSRHVIDTYIIHLDPECSIPGNYPWRAIALPSSEMKKLEGK